MAYTKFLHVFGTKQEHDTARSYGEGGEYHEPWVAYVNDNSKLVTYNKGWSEKYLTFKALESGTFKFSGNTINYSLDGGETWTELASNTSTTVSAGETIMFKAALTPTDSVGIGEFSSTARYEAMGNPYSLLYGDDFGGKIDLTGKNYALRGLFSGSTGLTSAEYLSLPATSLSENCYGYMFKGCTSLTTAPELPATTLANYCYQYMFNGCTSLTTAPVLPATTLAANCYYYMFEGCTSLTTAPELPATTLANYCYYYMFQGCTSLTTAPVLPATTLAQSCYFAMFRGCTSLTKAPELPATTLANYCYGTMFQGCTSLTTAPELPATMLAYSCYNDMFYRCTSLTAAPSVLPATTLANYCYQYMFYGCTSLTTAPVLPATTLSTVCYGDMFRGCTNLNYIKAMFTTTPSSAYTSNWVSGVASIGTFVKNSAATWNVKGSNGIPTRWTVETASA